MFAINADFLSKNAFARRIEDRVDGQCGGQHVITVDVRQREPCQSDCQRELDLPNAASVYGQVVSTAADGATSTLRFGISARVKEGKIFALEAVLCAV